MPCFVIETEGMKILFITSTNLGDGVLSTGILDHFIRTCPSAEVTVACGPLLAGLFAAAPNVRRVISLRKEPYAGHWRKLLRQTLWQKWDIVVDLRNTPFSRLYLARQKFIWSNPVNDLHKVAQMGRLIGQTPPPAPRLWPDAAAEQKAQELIPDGAPVFAIAPAAKWPGKMWAPDRFADLARRITAADGPLPQGRIAVFAAPGEEGIAHKVLDALPADRRIDIIAKTSPLEAAAALSRCALYVGNDSGLTHTAAAMGVPTLALFGSGFPVLYRPWGGNADCLVAEGDILARMKDYLAREKSATPPENPYELMDHITVTAAFAAAVKLFDRVSK